MLHEDEDEDEDVHPLDSPSVLIRICQYLFHFWILKTIKNDNIMLDDLPNVPQKNRAKTAYNNWMKVYKYRSENNLPTNVSSMIYDTEKYIILRCIFLAILQMICYMAILYVMKVKIWPLFINNDVSFINIIPAAIFLFVLTSLKSLCYSYQMGIGFSMRDRVTSCLQYLLIKKSLFINYKEADKQQLITLIGTDLMTIQEGIGWIIVWGFQYIMLLICTIFMMLYLVGISALFGITFMLLIGMPLQLFFGAKLSLYARLRKTASDKRVQLIAELIRSIRFLKVNASEMALMDNVEEYRVNELKFIRKRNLFLSFLILGNFLIPAFMLIITLSSYLQIFKHEIDTKITLFFIMVLTLNAISVKPLVILAGMITATLVSFKRMDKYLSKQSVDTQYNVIRYNTENSAVVEIENGCFEWKSEQDAAGFRLKNINLRVIRGKLIGIVGIVGSGKTSLLQSILGEMDIVKGSKYLNCKNICYCSQTPYIRNASLRDNIIMDLEYNEDKYKQCIIASALYSDLKILPNYDLTQIGDEGVNISGGQKMRVAFARALYRDNCDLYLFDDVLSCVDIYVGRQMFLNGNIKYLKNKNKTCLMVINSHLHLLNYFDEIIIIDKGEIKQHISINKLFKNVNHNKIFEKYKHLLPDEIMNKNEENKHNEDELDDEKKNGYDFNLNNNQNVGLMDEDKLNDLEPLNWRIYLKFIASSLSTFDYKKWFYNETVNNTMSSNFKLIIIGSVILAMFVTQSCSPLANVWILVWHKDTAPNTENDEYFSNKSNAWYLSIWFLLLTVIALTIAFLMYYVGKICANSSHYIHSNTLCNILRANTLFFDITPRGRILNLFSSDTDTMDIKLPMRIFQEFIILSDVFGLWLMNIIIIPIPMILCTIFLVPFFLIAWRKFKKTHLSVSVLVKIYLSPILTLSTEICNNLDSIRAHKLQDYFLNIAAHQIDTYFKCYFNVFMMSCWFISYQELLFNFGTMSVVLILGIYLSNNDFDPLFINLSIWNCIILQIGFGNVFQLFALISSDFVSVRRMLHFCDDKSLINISESQQINTNYRSVNNWPSNGDINISSLKLKYREHFDIVLNIDSKLEIKKGSKIGICGRTGSGKSSILVSIFRLFEPIWKHSKIEIDDIDISKLGLFDLRSNLSIIMQTPILFVGNLRFNLDPFNECSDDEIWDSLKYVQLFDLISNRENKLLCLVHENGSNFSLGEKQLICFARALLKKSQILFMDESTSSIDKNTDLIIQKLIRSPKFKNVTVICIAHRLKTIIDYDKILVLKNGKIKEFDQPNNLLKNKNSTFSKLVKINNLYYNNL